MALQSNLWIHGILNENSANTLAEYKLYMEE